MLKVGIIDSGVVGLPPERVAASRVFALGPGATVHPSAAGEDRLGHGTALAEAILAAVGECSLYNAQVFTRTLSCTAGQVALALDWLVEQDVQLVNMSFGLREDRAVLRSACERALAAGVTLVAAAPARGEAVFPASYPGVIRATGDARCAPGELSFLGTDQADFGACVRAGSGQVAGASAGCAHVSAFAAQYFARASGGAGGPVGRSGHESKYGSKHEPKHESLRRWLIDRASYQGPERRVC